MTWTLLCASAYVMQVGRLRAWLQTVMHNHNGVQVSTAFGQPRAGSAAMETTVPWQVTYVRLLYQQRYISSGAAAILMPGTL